MALEIERRFLVFKDQLPPLTNGQHFIQGYLSLDPQIRYRMIDDKVIIAIKTKEEGKVGRNEWEFENSLDQTEREKLMALAVRKPIEKIRYMIPREGLVWEIDVYQGDNEGLVTAEVELSAADHPISFPDWIDSASEIGSDPKYRNSNLGEHPYKTW